MQEIHGARSSPLEIIFGGKAGGGKINTKVDDNNSSLSSAGQCTKNI